MRRRDESAPVCTNICPELLSFIVTAAVFCSVLVPQASAQGIDYSVSFSGVEDGELLAALREKSLLINLKDKKPLSSGALRRRAGNDAGNCKDALRESGYFGAECDYDIVSGQDGKLDVVIKVATGSEYRVSGYKILWAGEVPDVPGIADIDLPDGETVSPDGILAPEQEVINALMRHGYPFPEVVSRTLEIDHAAATATPVITMDAGGMHNFGSLSIAGNESVDEDFIRRRIAWQDGEPFDIRKVAKTRKALLRSGVISGAEIKYPDAKNASEELPVSLELREGKHRTVGAGASFSTSRGPMVQAFHEHRNLFGGAEKLRSRIEAGTNTYAVTTELDKPDMFGDRAFSWHNSAEIRSEKLEAFDRDRAILSTSVAWQYSPSVSLSGGATLERTSLDEDNGEKSDFTLVGLPLSLKYDNTDSLLNPREGWRLQYGLVPYKALNDPVSFVETDIGVSGYLALGERLVWANRARTGALLGQSRSDIPADKRFYAGGGGSVRGYGHQLIGPLDENGNPTGGRMLVELGSELRLMATDTVEVVGFYEGARVTQDLDASGGEKFYWGTGAGARYHSAVGPVRVDIAVPVNKRDVDDPYQFYISLGQAF